MKTTKLNRFCGVVSALALIGCGEMSDNAAKSASNSGRAANAGEQAAANSGDMRNIANGAYGDGRQSASRESRRTELDKMMAATSLEAKTAAATAYFNGFEYQLWKSSRFAEDTVAKREVLFQSAVSEFFKTVQDFIRQDSQEPFTTAYYAPLLTGAPYATGALNAEMEPTTTAADLANTAKLTNVTALAMTMHALSARQVEYAKAMSFEARTMFDLIESGLAYRIPLSEGAISVSSLPLYAQAVLADEALAIQLLTIRANALTAKGLSNSMGPMQTIEVPNPNDPTRLTKKRVPKAMLPMLAGATEWMPDWTLFRNSVQTANDAAALQAGMKAWGALKSAGITPALAAGLSEKLTLKTILMTVNLEKSASPQNGVNVEGLKGAMSAFGSAQTPVQP